MDDGRSFVDADDEVNEDAVRNRTDELARRAAADEAWFSPPPDPPAPVHAMRYLRDGAGQAIALYTHLRTGGRLHRFNSSEFERLEQAMNTWFRLYAACYGIEIDPQVSMRTAAEVFVDTEDVSAVARTVTGVPRD